MEFFVHNDIFDSNRISRRSALASAVAAFVAAKPSLAFEGSVQSTVHDAIPPLNKDNSEHFRGCKWKIYSRDVGNNDKFTDKQRGLAGESLRHCLCHMLNPEYLKLALSKMRAWFVIDKWSLPHGDTNEFDRSVRHQFQALRDNGFIHVTIDPWIPDDPRYSGQAYVKEGYQIKVKPRQVGNKIGGYDYDSSGSFNLWLNGQALEDHGAKRMAGTVAHEMLHQMGHEHRNGYKDDNFMTVFGDIVANEGRFVSRSKSRDSDIQIARNVACPVGLEKFK